LLQGYLLSPISILRWPVLHACCEKTSCVFTLEQVCALVSVDTHAKYALTPRRYLLHRGRICPPCMVSRDVLLGFRNDSADVTAVFARFARLLLTFTPRIVYPRDTAMPCGPAPLFLALPLTSPACREALPPHLLHSLTARSRLKTLSASFTRAPPAASLDNYGVDTKELLVAAVRELEEA